MIIVIGDGLTGLSLSNVTDTKKTVKLPVGKPDSETVNFPVRAVFNSISVVLPDSILVLPLNNSKVKSS